VKGSSRFKNPVSLTGASNSMAWSPARRLSVAELKSLPMPRQITHLACEEGWSYIAEWIGVPLSDILPHSRRIITGNGITKVFTIG
jgi:hypothetical protein